jgi:outer membrane receptor protein involved in Fe transport
MEQNKQTLDSYSSDNATDPVHYVNDELKFFPSANLSVQINENSVLKASYGMTINRPEFREIAPFAYYDFELIRVIRGIDSLTNSLIHNFDLRYEFYPSAAVIISLGAFYKNFMSPSKPSKLIRFRRDYTFQNALGAYIAGLELDIRKSFANLGKRKAFFAFFVILAW